MLLGYARVSTDDQHLDLQRDALRKAGVAAKDLYTDTGTGVKAERPGLQAALSHLREGDTLVVWRLDRLGRSLQHLLETVTALKDQGVAFKSLTENIDTSTATGNLVFHIFGALAEFERNLIKERTVAGLESARARGRTGGRPRRNPESGRVALAKRLYRDSRMSIPEILKTLNISKATLYRWLDIGGGNRAKP
jgi:DNA invertase Pin-like site-specific DNA recombinase